jgi:hypothetical protein
MIHGIHHVLHSITSTLLCLVDLIFLMQIHFLLTKIIGIQSIYCRSENIKATTDQSDPTPPFSLQESHKSHN